MHEAHGVAFDAAGEVWVTGLFEGAIDFGDGPVASQGGTEMFLVRLAL